MIGSMPNHDRFECQTMIDSDAILQSNSNSFGLNVVIPKQTLLQMYLPQQVSLILGIN